MTDNMTDFELLNILIENPQAYYESLLSSPLFKSFVEKHKYKTTEEIMKECNIVCLGK